MNSAHEFTVRLQELLRRERVALADFLVALAEFDAKRLWVDLGHTSLFYFLHRELGLSKGAAQYRKTAAELIQRYPELVEPLRDGRLCITTIVELAKAITPENRTEVLPRFFHLSKSEAKEVTAELRPVEVAPRRDIVTVARAAAAPSILALPAPDLGQSVRPANQTQVKNTPPAPPCERERSAPLAPVSQPRAQVEPLNSEERRFHFTASRRFHEKLGAARDALSHSHPNASFEEILEAGLDLLLDRHAKRRGLVAKPRAVPPPPADPEYVPAHVRREAWKRDGGCCQWALASGGICGSTRQVELDHLVVKARGGAPTVANLRCLCRFHNDLAAREVFGDSWMDQFTRSPRTLADHGASRVAPVV